MSNLFNLDGPVLQFINKIVYNNSHQYSTEQKTETDKQCVFEHGANRIIESGKKREYIH